MKMIEVGFAFEDKVYMEFVGKGYQFEEQGNAFGNDFYGELTKKASTESQVHYNLKQLIDYMDYFIDYKNKNEYSDFWTDLIEDNSFPEIFENPKALLGFTEGRRAWIIKEIMGIYFKLI
jgi:hypothetical protein